MKLIQIYRSKRPTPDDDNVDEIVTKVCPFRQETLQSNGILNIPAGRRSFWWLEAGDILPGFAGVCFSATEIINLGEGAIDM